MKRISVFCLLLATSAAAQRAPATSDDLFARIAGVREMSDGRVLVGDAGANALMILSPDFRGVQRVEQPSKSVTALFPAPRGTTTLFDLDGARLHEIDGLGRASGGDTVPAISVGSRPMTMEIM